MTKNRRFISVGYFLFEPIVYQEAGLHPDNIKNRQLLSLRNPKKWGNFLRDGYHRKGE